MFNLSIRNWLTLMGGLSIVLLLLLGGISLMNTQRLSTVVGEANNIGI
jgi:hypothetical protein